MRQIIFWVMLVCVFGFNSSLFAQASPDEAAINALIGKVTEAWNNRDADSLASLVDESVIYVDSSGNQIQGKEAYCERHKEVLKNPALKESRSSSTLRGLSVFPASENAGSLAVADVQWRLTNIRSTDKQKAPDRQGHSDLVLKKGDDENWKLLAHRTYLQKSDREAAVRAVFAERLKGWQEKDVDILLGSMAEDVVYESSNGETVTGKTPLRERYAELLAGPLKESTHTETIKSIRFIQDDLAIVHADWINEIGDTSKSGSSTALLRKFQQKSWKVVSVSPAATQSKGE